MAKNTVEVDAAEQGEHHEQTDHQAPIPDDVHNKRLARGSDGRRPLKEKSDQQVRRQTNTCPPDKEPQIVIRQHEQQHREDEEVHLRKEAPVTQVAVHVSD
jgi:hypothetical protein